MKTLNLFFILTSSLILSSCFFGPECGNSILEDNEDCDGKFFAPMYSNDCRDWGYNGGMVKCSNCGLDFSECEDYGTCGDGVLSPSEECDGNLMAAQTCGELGFPGGNLSCKDCFFDISECEICGDSKIDEGEICDAFNGGEFTCNGETGIWGGPVTCMDDCATPSFDNCDGYFHIASGRYDRVNNTFYDSEEGYIYLFGHTGGNLHGNRNIGNCTDYPLFIHEISCDNDIYSFYPCTDAFILKTDTSGRVIKTIQFGTEGNDTTHFAGLNDEGNIIIIERNNGGFSFSDYSMVNSNLSYGSVSVGIFNKNLLEISSVEMEEFENISHLRFYRVVGYNGILLSGFKTDGRTFFGEWNYQTGSNRWKVDFGDSYTVTEVVAAGTGRYLVKTANGRNYKYHMVTVTDSTFVNYFNCETWTPSNRKGKLSMDSEGNVTLQCYYQNSYLYEITLDSTRNIINETQEVTQGTLTPSQARWWTEIENINVTGGENLGKIGSDYYEGCSATNRLAFYLKKPEELYVKYTWDLCRLFHYSGITVVEDSILIYGVDEMNYYQTLVYRHDFPQGTFTATKK